jgi:LmbE family N-acetylglucosaminyl deacetylase
METRKLLAVFAHPDDESFGIGGTLALYSQRNVDISLICATRGEAGNFPDALQRDGRDLATLREDELLCAADVLGLKRVEFLDYRDSGMTGSSDNNHRGNLMNASIDEVAAKITRHIRSIRPDVVITFNSQGGYQHPDHIAIYKATVEAYNAAGEPDRYPDGLEPYTPKKLYYATFPNRWLRFVVRIMPLFGKDPRKWGRNEDIDLVEITKISYPIHAKINIRSTIELKQQASACHASQLDGSSMQNPFTRLVLRLGQNNENFMRAIPSASAGTRETDLFEGI